MGVDVLGLVQSLRELILGNSYMYAFSIFVGALIVAKLMLIFFKKVLEHHAKHHSHKLDDKIITRVENPIIVVIILIGAQLALREIITSTNVLQNTINTIIVFVLTYMFIGIAHIVMKFWEKRKQAEEAESSEAIHEEVLPLMKSLVKIFLIIIAVIVVLQLWGVQVGALVASLGIIGIVLGFAFKDTLGNIFGGISLIMDNSLHKKDVIKLEDGQMGEVVEINLRSTKIKTFDNEYLIIPNGVLANRQFTNLAEPTPTLRIMIPVSVAYGSDVAKVKEVLLETLKGDNDVLRFPKREVRFVKMSEYSLDFQFLFYIKNYKDLFSMKDQYTTKAYAALQEAGLVIPFPTRIIYSEKGLPKSKKAVSKRSTTKKAAKKSTRKSSKKTSSRKKTKK